MGAAGLTCSAVEMGDKGSLGIRLDLDRVPVREAGMSAYEMVLSESQERMLMVLRPEKEPEARAIFEKWDLDFAIVGETLPEDRFVVRHDGRVKADLPLKALSGTAPEYDRPFVETPPPAPAPDLAPVDPAQALLRLMASPNLCSRAWVWQQYDHMVGADTVVRPGSDAAVVLRARHWQGRGADGRRDAALLPGRPGAGRPPGSGRGLSATSRPLARGRWRRQTT